MARPTRQFVINSSADLTAFKLNRRCGNTNAQAIHWLQRIGVLPPLNPNYYVCPNDPNPQQPTHVLTRQAVPSNNLPFQLRCTTCRTAGRETRFAFTKVNN